jgi:ABC-type lipoprotein release transport system permease subunit
LSKTELKSSGNGRFKFALHIAGRYLFSKKSHNAINVISGISAIGVAIGTMALIVVLSVFNGLESLFSGLFSSIDPHLKITLNEGKIMDVSTSEFRKIKKLEGVAHFTEVIEENALLKFKEKQMPVVVKGVSEEFNKMNSIDSILFDGKFVLFDGAFERSVPGVGIANTLGLGAHFIDPLFIYAPKRTATINMVRPESSFNEAATFVSGVFSVQQNEYDNKFVFVSLNLARTLFEYKKTEVSSVEIGLNEMADVAAVKSAISLLLGDKFNVKDRYEQQESYFNIMRIEKWMTFLILAFIVLIASFNIIGSLSMLIIEKSDDIVVLRNLGADQSLIKLIFLFEGWMISIIGAIVGLVLGAGLAFIQEKIGIFKLGPGFIIENYPSVTQFSDIILVFLTVTILGFLSAWYPAKYINIKNR